MMKKTKPFVSIVITTYHRSDRLENAIVSAEQQTYNNCEIIVVDDNADKMEERNNTDRIVKRHKNIRLIKNEHNLGGGLSRNAGIVAARGELISFLDDDDQYLPNRIEKLIKIIEEHKDDNIGLAYCSCSTVDEKNRIVGEYVNVKNGLPFYEQMMGCVAGTSMWLAPKNVLEKIGYFDDVPSKQDSTVILKMLVAGYKIFGIPDKLVLYYEHQGGNGISGTKISNAKGLILYREKCRKQYYNISKEEAVNVECNFSRQLITIFLINGKDNNAKKELKNIWKNKPFSVVYFKNLIKILFKKQYLRKIVRNNKND